MSQEIEILRRLETGVTLTPIDALAEKWVNLSGDNEGYQISNFGRVKSMERMVLHPTGSLKKVREKILKQANRGNGYFFICFGKRRKNQLIHRIVASSFIPNPNSYPCVNHKNGDKKDNREVNLEWCSYSQNELHSYSVLGKKPVKSNLGNMGIKSWHAKPVAKITEDRTSCEFYGSACEAARELNSTQGRISDSCRNSRKHRGHYFKYITKEEYFSSKRIIEKSGQVLLAIQDLTAEHRHRGNASGVGPSVQKGLG